jgi:hypothetical protein
LRRRHREHQFHGHVVLAAAALGENPDIGVYLNNVLSFHGAFVAATGNTFSGSLPAPGRINGGRSAPGVAGPVG